MQSSTTIFSLLPTLPLPTNRSLLLLAWRTARDLVIVKISPSIFVDVAPDKRDKNSLSLFAFSVVYLVQLGGRTVGWRQISKAGLKKQKSSVDFSVVLP